jgi:predicted DNA-binding protein YlxM (UPF0122 family)
MKYAISRYSQNLILVARNLDKNQLTKPKKRVKKQSTTMWYMVAGEPCEMKKQRVDGKITRKQLIKEAACGLSQAEIARKYGCSRAAVHNQFKRLINDEAVQLYDNHLPAILKTAAVLHISDSVNDAKRKKSSALQSATAGGICLTHLQGLPKTQINIQVIQQNLNKMMSEREKIELEIRQLSDGTSDGICDYGNSNNLAISDSYQDSSIDQISIEEKN